MNTITQTETRVNDFGESRFWNAWHALGRDRETGEQFVDRYRGDFFDAAQALNREFPQEHLLAGVPAHVDRIDLFGTDPANPDRPGTTIVWRQGWKHQRTECLLTTSISQALAALREEGWTVREWPGGGRAWRHGLRVARSRRQIAELRADMEQAPWAYEYLGNLRQYDLQYDLDI